MKMKFFVLTFILLLPAYMGLSQEIKLPEERITGQDIRIEKTRIFIFPVPSFKIVLPELREYGEVFTEDKTTQKGPGGNISFIVGSNNTMGISLSSHFLHNSAMSYIDTDGSLSRGYRENSERKKISFNFKRDSSTSTFSAGISGGVIELPGPEDSPFPDRKRDFFSFNTSFSFIKSSFTPYISQRFYNIDSDEINFTTLKLQIDKTPFIFETGIERQDVFNNNFSSTAMYQSINFRNEQITIGGTLKGIERYGIRFIPSITYHINDNLTLHINGTYKIPDLYSDIISDEYKEIINHNITPDEEHKMSLSFHKKSTDTDFYLDISPSYRDNFYGWADIDKNGLFEPYPQKYWQMAINILLQHRFSEYFTGYLKGEKRFLSEEIDYYPEELFDTGFTVNYKNISFNIYLSYTGDRVFSGKTLGSDTVFNTEMVFRKENQVEWGIGVYNILDREYLSVPGYPEEGRNILSFIRFLF